MSKRVVFNFGLGSFEAGFPSITAELWETDGVRLQQLCGSLPPAPEIIQNLKLPIIRFFCCLTLLGITLTITPNLAQAENNSVTQQTNNRQQLQTFQRRKLPNNGAPKGRRRGIGGRSECPKELSQITALLPAFTEEGMEKSTIERTLAQFPTFWVYVPELPTNARFAEFTIQDIDNQKKFFRQELLLSGQAGIINLQLPNKPEYALKNGNRYQWILTVYCNEEPAISEEYISVDGYIQQVALNQNIKPDDYLTLAENNLWYDSLTILAEFHRDRPKDEIIHQDWLELLKTVNLADISNAKFRETYKFTE
ncbi:MULTISPECIES: DUF928 domain-containing protein [Calothrix]|uniref:DUF928 domain-containing protein n=2 Tax=Calothrix TaxID=1186 RepID=A0ABR8AGU6_9CYAN|nr:MULTISPECIES: DUF928 domain-containing protein [Calothrix]MBD2199156.1 DUF928 domain-containing protein [Calothrix parietina FACHB-288]MBD2227858.1 DUF928 domain-containing protein [Calothrix anomala FACHB-343]